MLLIPIYDNINQTCAQYIFMDKTDLVEKFLLEHPIKYKLWWKWPIYFDCGGAVDRAIHEVYWYNPWLNSWNSHKQHKNISKKNVIRGDILINTNPGQNHVARIAWKNKDGTVTILDYYNNHTVATYRKHGIYKWIFIIRLPHHATRKQPRTKKN